MKLSTNVERKLREHVAMHHEPFYLYDREVIRATCERFRFLKYQPMSLHFACMANANPEFLSLIRDEGLGVFVNSIPHLEQATACGFSGRKIVFAASSMSESTMRAVREVGAIVNLDSVNQVKEWQALFPEVPFGVRCNIGGLVEAKRTRGGYFIGRKSRLGMTPDEFLGLSGNRLVEGLHLYVGTDITDVDYFRECYHVVGSFADAFPALRYIDVGGGFGLRDENGNDFDIDSYDTMVNEFMTTLSGRLGKPLELVLEPGRLIGAKAGWFVCKVVDIKHRGERQILGVNASAVQFPRPLFYPDSAVHPVSLLRHDPTMNGVHQMPTSICGCSTYSRDFLAHDVMLPRAEIGDIVVLGDAGSYCAAAYTHFLGFPQPREIFHDCEGSRGHKGIEGVLFSSQHGL